MRIHLCSLIFITVFSSSVVKAQMSFNDFQHAGSGCPQGTVAFSPSPDGQSASILFDEFSAQVPQFDGINDNGEIVVARVQRQRTDPLLQHKACNLAFSVELPEGQMVESLEVSIFNRGSTILDPGVRAALSTIFVGHQGLRNISPNSKPPVTVLERKIWGAMRNRNLVDVFDDWVSEPVHSISINSACASRYNENTIRFELKNHLEVEIMDSDLDKTGLIVMDSSDVNGVLKFRVKTRPCQVRQSGGNMRPQPAPPRVPTRYPRR